MNQHLSPNSTNLENSDHIHWFRHVAPYINTHRNKTFVVMFGGEAVSHANFHDMIYDFALLHSLGIRLVLVHGSRPQMAICNRRISPRLFIKIYALPQKLLYPMC